MLELANLVIEKESLTQQTDIEIIQKAFVIKKGFPPRPMQIENKPITELGIKNGDNLVVEIDKSVLKVDYTNWKAVQLKVDSDGACLFNSISKAIEGTTDKPD